MAAETFKDRVGEVIFNMPTDKISNGDKKFGEYSITKNVKAENQERFIACVKEYIDKDFGRQDGFEVLFSDDYESVLKILLP